jgi:ribosome-associated toxin RatA of RatAB toxin-antitoxin module
MTNTWLIEGLSLHETKISFDIEFKLKNPLLEVPARASIDYIGTNIVNCFENRINFLPKATKIPN